MESGCDRHTGGSFDVSGVVADTQIPGPLKRPAFLRLGRRSIPVLRYPSQQKVPAPGSGAALLPERERPALPLSDRRVLMRGHVALRIDDPAAQSLGLMSSRLVDPIVRFHGRPERRARHPFVPRRGHRLASFPVVLAVKPVQASQVGHRLLMTRNNESGEVLWHSS